MVASKSQMRPLRTEIHISEFGSIMEKENVYHRTCFQRMPPKPEVPPARTRMRSKPMSMIRSNTTSETREKTTLSLVLSKLSRAQVFASGDHAERIYRMAGKPSGSKTVKIKTFTSMTPVMSPR
jgi:hypothetical protein